MIQMAAIVCSDVECSKTLPTFVAYRKSRWFVLKEEALYYYKSKEEPLLLGALPLRGAHIDDPDSANRPPEARCSFFRSHQCIAPTVPILTPFFEISIAMRR